MCKKSFASSMLAVLACTVSDGGIQSTVQHAWQSEQDFQKEGKSRHRPFENGLQHGDPPSSLEAMPAALCHPSSKHASDPTKACAKAVSCFTSN